MSLPHFSSSHFLVETPAATIRSSDFRLAFSFKNNLLELVNYTELVVASFKQVAHNEYKLALTLVDNNAEDLLALNARGKTVLINKLALFNSSTQKSFTLLEDKLLIIEDTKMTQLGTEGFLAPPVFLTLRLFDYKGKDVEELTLN